MHCRIVFIHTLSPPLLHVTKTSFQRPPKNSLLWIRVLPSHRRKDPFNRQLDPVSTDSNSSQLPIAPPGVVTWPTCYLDFYLQVKYSSPHRCAWDPEVSPYPVGSTRDYVVQKFLRYVNIVLQRGEKKYRPSNISASQVPRSCKIASRGSHGAPARERKEVGELEKVPSFCIRERWARQRRIANPLIGAKVVVASSGPTTFRRIAEKPQWPRRRGGETCLFGRRCNLKPAQPDKILISGFFFFLRASRNANVWRIWRMRDLKLGTWRWDVSFVGAGNWRGREILKRGHQLWDWHLLERSW